MRILSFFFDMLVIGFGRREQPSSEAFSYPSPPSPLLFSLSQRFILVFLPMMITPLIFFPFPAFFFSFFPPTPFLQGTSRLFVVYLSSVSPLTRVFFIARPFSFFSFFISESWPPSSASVALHYFRQNWFFFAFFFAPA